MDKKAIFSTVPSRKARTPYPPSIKLLLNITEDAQATHNPHDPTVLTVDEILCQLLDGETIIVNRFGEEVHWTLESLAEAVPNARRGDEQVIETYRGYQITKKLGMSRYSLYHEESGAPAGSYIDGLETARQVVDHYILEIEDIRGKRYTVEQQANSTHAIFCNGGFIIGDFPSHDRARAVACANKLADADEEFGVPVAARAK